MNYLKELVELLRYTEVNGDIDPQNYVTNLCGGCYLCERSADVIEKLEKQVPKWIPVTERLPEAGIEVLAMLQVNKFDGHDAHNVVTAVLMPCDSWLVADYLEGIEAETTGTDCEDCCHWITYWMPLPEPPKGD